MYPIRFNNVESSVSSEMGRRTSEITSGFVSVAERGGSNNIQPVTVNAISRVEKVTKKGTRDVRRTTLLAQRAVKKNTDVMSSLPLARDSRIFTSLRLLALHPKLRPQRLLNGSTHKLEVELTWLVPRQKHLS